MKKKKILTIGGGSGQFSLLSGLRDLEGIEITAVVSMFCVMSLASFLQVIY